MTATDDRTSSATAPSDAGAALPHERDERSEPAKEDGQHRRNRKPIEQARRDVESGLRDTERIGTPNDVPVAAPKRDE